MKVNLLAKLREVSAQLRDCGVRALDREQKYEFHNMADVVADAVDSHVLFVAAINKIAGLIQGDIKTPDTFTMCQEIQKTLNAVMIRSNAISMKKGA